MVSNHEIYQLLDGLDGEEIRRRAAAFTYLTRTQLAGALVGGTVFAMCPDLSQARGLDELTVNDPCSLDLPTLEAHRTRLPESFLNGCGVDPIR